MSNITQAMRVRCRQLANGAVLTRSSVTMINFKSDRSHGNGMTYDMALRMEEAGLIEWTPPTKFSRSYDLAAGVPSYKNRQTAVLTEAGKSAAVGGSGA